MLRRTRRSLSAPLAATLCASLIACAVPAAHAAELGEPRVSSHLGQQLVADIELTLLDDPATPVQARLASPEIYSEAGIAVPAVLSSLNLSVMRRDGRQFLHATTLRPVDADHLHLYLELVDHGQRVVRLATLWLTPDPNPAPVALPAPVPAVAAPAVPARASVPTPAPVRAPVRARAEADLAPAPPRAPAAMHARPALTMTTPAPVPRPAPPLPAAQATPLPLRVPAPARPAACMPQGGEAQACVVLGARNAELRTRIGELEQRVKGLQASLSAGQGKPTAKAAPAIAPAVHAAPAPAAPAIAKPAPAKPAAQQPAAAKPAAQQPAAAKPAAQQPAAIKPAAQQPAAVKPVARQPAARQPAPPPAGPAPIASIKPLVPHKPKTAPPADELPWGLVGAGLALLAALGGAAALARVRRKRTRKAELPAAPGVLPRLRERFFARNGG